MDTELSLATALVLLRQSDLSSDMLATISKNASLMKDRKVKLAVIQHPKTPRHIVLPVLRHLFTFDLMRVALTPAIASDIKVAAEESLVNRLDKLSLGEKLSLARHASGRVVAALLRDPELRVVHTALDNGRLTETVLVKEVMGRNTTVHLAMAIADHPKWSVRNEIRLAIRSREDKAAKGFPAEHSSTEGVAETEKPSDPTPRPRA